jgi:hypothetical protein
MVLSGFATPIPLASPDFTIDDVTEGAYLVGVGGPGIANKIITDVTIHGGQATDLGTITLDTGRTLRGQVVDRVGAPVTSARVAVGGAHDGRDAPAPLGPQVVRSDAKGRFEVAGFDDQAVAVASTPTARSRPTPVPATGELVLVVAPTGSLTGAVTSSGKPASHVFVIASAGATSTTAMTDAAGRYVFARLAAGDYCVELIEVGKQGPTEKACGVAVASGATVTRDIAQ